jgi:predicted nucleotidyltransferase
MDYRRPFLAVTPTLDGDVLAALSRGDVELSGRELARHVGYGSTEGIRRAADRLVLQGTVQRRRAGGAHLYRLNRAHLAAPYVEGLANLRGELIARLRGLLAEWSQPPKVALLFGSVARGQANAGSDIDVLMVRPRGVDPDGEAWRTQVFELQRSATTWTGNDTRVVEYGEAELGDLQGESLVAEALADGIELHGSRRMLKRLVTSGKDK